MNAHAIREARERLGESQRTFGERFGVDQSTIHRWEKEGIPEHGPARVAVQQVLAEISREEPSATHVS